MIQSCDSTDAGLVFFTNSEAIVVGEPQCQMAPCVVAVCFIEFGLSICFYVIFKIFFFEWLQRMAAQIFL